MNPLILTGHQPTRAELKPHYQLCQLRWVGALILDWNLIGLAFAAMSLTTNPVVWIVSLFVIGARQQALGWLAHDAVHHTALENRRLADVVANLLCFWPLGVDVHAFREFHFRHHKHLGTELDPEEEHLPLPSVPCSKLALFVRFVGHSLGGAALGTLRVSRLLQPETNARKLGMALLHGLAIIATVIAEAPWIVPVWVLAQLTTLSAFFQLRLLMEHTEVPGFTHRLVVGPIWRFFVHPHNSWAHDEHHRYPAAPSSRLEALSQLTATGDERTPLELVDRLIQSSARPATRMEVAS